MARDMPVILFRCPHCGLETEVAPQFAGRSGPCAGCGRPVRVPPAGPAERTGKLRQAGNGRPSHDLLRVLLILVPTVTAVGLLLYGGARLLAPTVQTVRQTAERAACVSNLQRIAAALRAYQGQYGHFPPAFSQDEAGRPMHSWRVLILPFLGNEAAALYARIDLTKPWDSPQNSAVGQAVPSVYRCRAEDRGATFAGAQDTSYLAVVGPECVFRGGDVLTAGEIQRPDRTLLVVEANNCAVHWMEPVDLASERLTLGINPGTTPAVASGHATGGAHLLMADGTVRFLPDTTDPEQLRQWAFAHGTTQEAASADRPAARSTLQIPRAE